MFRLKANNSLNNPELTNLVPTKRPETPTLTTGGSSKTVQVLVPIFLPDSEFPPSLITEPSEKEQKD